MSFLSSFHFIIHLFPFPASRFSLTFTGVSKPYPKPLLAPNYRCQIKTFLSSIFTLALLRRPVIRSPVHSLASLLFISSSTQVLFLSLRCGASKTRSPKDPESCPEVISHLQLLFSHPSLHFTFYF